VGGGPDIAGVGALVTTAIKGVDAGSVVIVDSWGPPCGHDLVEGVTYLFELDQAQSLDWCRRLMRVEEVGWAGTPWLDYDMSIDGPYLWLPRDLARVQYTIDQHSESALREHKRQPFPSPYDFRVPPSQRVCTERKVEVEGQPTTLRFDQNGALCD
jgi:hypothetical protein